MQEWRLFQEMIGTHACPTIQLFQPLALNSVASHDS